MNEPVADYTVKQVARMAGVSVRTLHHYDQIGLLKPSTRTAAGYRLYGESDLLRLQQVLFFRELDFPLEEIRRILDHPGFDQVKALENHRRMLQERTQRLAQLMTTIDRTIRRLQEEDEMLTDAELYEGFSQEQIERYKRETQERYDPKLVEESHRRVSKMSKAQWKAIREEGDAVTRRMAELMDRAPEDEEVQRTIARHHAWVEHFYPASAEVYRGLGQLYVEHPEFRAFYDGYRAGLADFMQAAMDCYCEQILNAE